MHTEMVGKGEKSRDPIFRDIRRYYCEFCGICRSKKALIAAHIQANHAEKELNEEKEHGEKLNKCEECGASFSKPAHLKQHMQSHSLERPFICSVDDCESSYRRKDHLNRHMLQHQGKLFECPVEGCKTMFTLQGNMTRHVKDFHCESAPTDIEHPKESNCGKLHKHEDSQEKLLECPVKDCKRTFKLQGYMAWHVKEYHGESAFTDVKHATEHVCAETHCGKVFRYPSKLYKHEDSHVKLDSLEAYCAEPGCMKYFSNERCLKEHIRSCHQYVLCDECGNKQLKKNIKRHMRMHEAEHSSGRISCSVKGCSLTFSRKSNLNKHMKAVHLKLKPFACGMPGCDKRFTFKHVRNNHEKSSCHVYTPGGDFEASDEQFRSRPRGGRKRKYPVIETLMRKRIVPPSESELAMNEGQDYPSWQFSN
ncbi:transcription factor IIIA-like isoform X2 [Salvia miltiorrhiza]|uniref:transcription factor IIIA-like isoform X2 n=1 Tax=Salvia miltiorrhiza TaxID=226208 RepID=UPI0025AD2A80|nr:transcription factor IIIA-like isoform X2 [Salvia miltiorrhiza]